MERPSDIILSMIAIFLALVVLLRVALPEKYWTPPAPIVPQAERVGVRPGVRYEEPAWPALF
jgi:hypothetical protein